MFWINPLNRKYAQPSVVDFFIIGPMYCIEYFFFFLRLCFLVLLIILLYCKSINMQLLSYTNLLISIEDFTWCRASYLKQIVKIFGDILVLSIYWDKLNRCLFYFIGETVNIVHDQEHISAIEKRLNGNKSFRKQYNRIRWSYCCFLSCFFNY